MKGPGLIRARWRWWPHVPGLASIGGTSADSVRSGSEDETATVVGKGKGAGGAGAAETSQLYITASNLSVPWVTFDVHACTQRPVALLSSGDARVVRNCGGRIQLMLALLPAAGRRGALSAAGHAQKPSSL